MHTHRNISGGDKKFLKESEMESITQKKWDAVEVITDIPKGCGLFASKYIPEKTTLCVYGGTRMSAKEAKALPGDTPYLFQFKEPTTDHVIFIDNEHQHEELGRFINHSSLHPNCKPVVKKWPNKREVSVIFVSTQPIPSGDQIVWIMEISMEWNMNAYNHAPNVLKNDPAHLRKKIKRMVCLPILWIINLKEE